MTRGTGTSKTQLTDEGEGYRKRYFCFELMNFWIVQEWIAKNHRFLWQH